jgi:hypothetical protein
VVTEVADAVDGLRGADDRRRVLGRGALEQRAVDVEEEQELGQRRKSVAGSSRRANAASSCDVRSTSSSWTISTGECM